MRHGDWERLGTVRGAEQGTPSCSGDRQVLIFTHMQARTH